MSSWFGGGGGSGGGSGVTSVNTRTGAVTLVNTDISGILNAQIGAGAAIAYSKLALTGSIVNGDLAGSIAASKVTGTAITAADTGTVTSAMIADGAIVNADVNAAAAIAYSKLALAGAILNTDLAGSIAYSKLVLTGAILNADLAGSIAASKITGTAITAADTGTVTSTMIADGTIVSGDLSATAGITSGQLAGSIAPSKVTGTAITAADSGTVTSAMIADGTIVTGDISGSAGITGAQLASGTVAVGNMTAASLERAFMLGKAGAIGATETNAADFPFVVPFNCTLLRMKVTLATAASGAMVVQLRTAAGPITTAPTYSDVSGFSVTFSNNNVLATSDPADVNVSEGDFLNFSCSTGSGTGMMVQVVVKLR